jgi:hypothetical protein
MRSRFHHGQCSAVPSTQSAQGNSLVAKNAFLHHFAFAIERTKPVPALSQI